MSASTGIKQKKERLRRITFVGLILMFAFAAVSPLPCSGMEALTQQELGDLSGRTGISLGFSSPATVTATFTTISFGDSDGWGDATLGNDSAGWLVLIGSGAALKIEVPADAQLDIDVGHTTSDCNPLSGAAYAGLEIPAGKTFFSFSLSETNIVLEVPDTIYIGLSQSGNSVGDKMGYMLADNVAIDKADKKSRCFIWTH